MSQVILHALIVVHHNRRAHRQGRDSKNRTQHPLGTRELRIEANQATVLIRDALEGAEDHLCLECDRLGLILSITAVHLALKSGSLSQNLRHLLEAGGLAVATLEHLLRPGSRTDVTNLLEPRKPRRCQLSNVIWICKGLRAIETYNVCKLLNHVEELVEIHRASQPNMAKVTGTELVGLLARRADLAVFDDTKPCIKHAICDGLVTLIGLVSRDLNNRSLEDIVGICNAKLDANNCIAHVYYLLLLCVDYSVLLRTR